MNRWNVLRAVAVMALIVLAVPVTIAQATDPKAIIISDMGRCTPKASLSDSIQPAKWRLLPYQTADIKGVMLAAGSFINAPEVTLSPKVSGWHAVYVGVWNPEFAYDGESVVKVKLSSDAAFRQLHLRGGADTQDVTCLREIHFTTDDLTNKDLVFGKANGIISRCSYIAYVKLVPIAPDEAKKIAADRADTSKRKLTATIDGLSYFHFSEYTKPEHILEEVELYRNSDVGKVLWAVGHGFIVGYPTKVKNALFLADPSIRAAMLPAGGSNDYVRGERQSYETLQRFAEQNLVAPQIAATRVKEMGLKFDLMFRIGMNGGVEGVGPIWSGKDVYTRHFPQYRQVMQDGTVIEKASLAFPAVQDFQLQIIREAIEKVDCDGINICFVRGPHHIAYEKPVVDLFRKQYGEDATKVDPADPRLGAVRSTFMTEFIRSIRKALDQQGSKRGRHLELSVWVWPAGENVWLGGTTQQEGLDVKQWVEGKLVDTVICQNGIDPEILALSKSGKCKFQLFTGYTGEKAMSPATISKAYESGVDEFAFWDIDLAQMYPELWEWISRIGHRDEMKAWKEKPNYYYPLINVNGVDVKTGMAGSIYSGG
jgi:hypothetical protein